MIISQDHYLVKNKISRKFVSANEAQRKVFTENPGVKFTVPSSKTFTKENGYGLDWRRDSFDLDELLSFEGDEFLDITYRCILKRAPDPAGARHYRGYMEKGYSGKAVIEALRYSTEGKRAGVEIAGITPRLLYKFVSAPVMRIRMLLAKR